MAQARMPAIMSGEGGLSRYLDEIRKFPMLEPQEEFMLAKRFHEHQDTDAAHRLVTAASAAWVFGGMGSWNDMGITDRAAGQRYREITDAFFAAVVDGYLVAANSFEPPAGV